jgi:hypothetical protein
MNGLDRFDLDQDTVLDEDIELQRNFSFKSLVSDDHGLLIADAKAAQFEFLGETPFIDESSNPGPLPLCISTAAAMIWRVSPDAFE